MVIQTVAEPWETPDLLALAAGRDPYATEDQTCGSEPPGGGPADASRDGPADGGGLLGGVVGWTDLTDPAVVDAVAGLRAGPGGEFLGGIRHPLLAEADPDWLTRPAVLRGLNALAATGLSFDIVALPHQLPAAVTFGSDWPVSAVSATYGEVCDMYRELTAELSTAEQEAIFDHTARRVYQLAGR